MTRKTSHYARKNRLAGTRTFNSIAWINTIQACAGYGQVQTVAGFNCETQSAAAMAEARVRGALESLLNHTPPADVERCFDVLSHALGVASIRAVQIQPDQANNPALAILNSGIQALMRAIDRWTGAKAFGLDADGRQALPDAVGVYSEILNASSPAQMEWAAGKRMEILMGQTKEKQR
jgi:hypothetical protein